MLDSYELVDLFGFGTADEVYDFLSVNLEFDINSHVQMGYTALGIASKYENIAVVKLMVSHFKADIDKCFLDLGGEPPLKIAYDQNNSDIYAFLLDKGADPSLPGWMGISVNHRIALKLINKPQL